MSTGQSSYTSVNLILVVEDDPDTAAFLKELLQSKGYSVELAKDGGQAQAAFAMHRPDFVLLDLILPNESGFEVCERMKKANENVPVLVLSAIELEDARNLARRVGADAYLTKPFDPDELCQVIRNVAENVWRRAHGLETSSEEGYVRFACPHCKTNIKVRVAHRGRTLGCPNCREHVNVPRH